MSASGVPGSTCLFWGLRDREDHRNQALPGPRGVQARHSPDWCYVNNFADPQRPRALRLPPGLARGLQADCERLLAELKAGVPRAFEAEAYEQQRRAILEELEKQTSGELEALQRRAEALGFGLVKTASGFMIIPMLRGKPLEPKGFEALDEDAKRQVSLKGEEVQKDMAATHRRVREMERGAKDRLDALDREVATSAVDHLIEEVKERYTDHPEAQAHFEAMREDVIASVDLFRRGQGGASGPAELIAMMQPGRDPFDRYRVNCLVEQGRDGGAPVVVRPTLRARTWWGESSIRCIWAPCTPTS